MLEYREDPGSDLIEIVVDGRVGREEFERVAARLEAAITRRGKLRLLEEIRRFGGVDPATFWADLRFSLRHLGDFSRCAVVTEKRWIAWLAKAMDPLVPCEIRHFPPERIAAARSWLGAPAPAAAPQADR